MMTNALSLGLVVTVALVSGAARSREPKPAAAAPGMSWVAGPVLPKARDHHATFLTTASDSTAYLWVAGGNDYHGLMADVWRLRLTKTGEPSGEWTQMSSLPVSLAGPGVAASENAVVIAGGQDSAMRKRTEVYVARVDANGELGAWQTASAMPWPAFHHSLVYHAGWVYATGGLSERVLVANAGRARLSSDGTLGPWIPMQQMPRPRSHHASFVIGGRLCVAGGLDGNPAGENTPLSGVLCAKLNEDGSAGPWEPRGTLPTAVATHAVAHGADWIAVLGGVVDNRDVTADVWRAAVDASGSIGAWERTTNLPAARSHVHQTPVWANRIYSVGGSDKRVVTGALQIGVITR